MRMHVTESLAPKINTKATLNGIRTGKEWALWALTDCRTKLTPSWTRIPMVQTPIALQRQNQYLRARLV